MDNQIIVPIPQEIWEGWASPFEVKNPPLPSWIVEKYPNYWEVDVQGYLATGQEIPIDLWRIPQFAGFWTMPYATMPRGSTINFKQPPPATNSPA